MRRASRRHVCLDASRVCLSRQARDVLFRDSVAACGGAIFGGRGALVALTRAAVRGCAAIDGGAIYLAGGQGVLWLERVRHELLLAARVCVAVTSSCLRRPILTSGRALARRGCVKLLRVYMWQFLPRG